VPAPNLKAAFEKHRNQTKGHVERLQQVFETMGKRPQGKTCEAIQGIIAEGEEIMEEFKDMPAFDAGLISSAQRSRAIWMMIGIGTPSSHRRIERISCSFASVEIP
jgi:ferritin-like metal-binding protein YciE